MDSKLLLFCHPESRACNKLLNILPQDIKNVEIINIQNISNIPPEITKIPALIKNQSELLLGKQVFDFFSESDHLGNYELNNNQYFSSITNQQAPKMLYKTDESKYSQKMKSMEEIQKERSEQDTFIKQMNPNTPRN